MTSNLAHHFFTILRPNGSGDCYNLEFSGHKHFKGDKVVAVCDAAGTLRARNCIIIAPLIAAPGNRNESPLLQKVLPQVTGIAKQVGLNLNQTIFSWDGVYQLVA